MGVKTAVLLMSIAPEIGEPPAFSSVSRKGSCEPISTGASSGANLKLSVSDKINAQASSGGNIKVSGDPKERNVQKSSGGDVDFN